MKLIYGIIVVMNVLGFTLMGFDKLKAKNKAWRVPEINFFIIALFGGALGVFLGMQTFRHKTRHFSFVFGIPVLFVLNILMTYLILQLVY